MRSRRYGTIRRRSGCRWGVLKCRWWTPWCRVMCRSTCIVSSVRQTRQCFAYGGPVIQLEVLVPFTAGRGTAVGIGAGCSPAVLVALSMTISSPAMSRFGGFGAWAKLGDCPVWTGGGGSSTSMRSEGGSGPLEGSTDISLEVRRRYAGQVKDSKDRCNKWCRQS